MNRLKCVHEILLNTSFCFALFRSWLPGEPTLSIKEDSCVSASATVQPAMSTVNCTDKLRFVCKLNAGNTLSTVKVSL